MKKTLALGGLVFLSLILIVAIISHLNKTWNAEYRFEVAFGHRDLKEAERIISTNTKIDWIKVINEKDERGRNYLMVFASGDQTSERVLFLLNNGADVNILNDRQSYRSALMYAAKRVVDTSGIIKLLLDHGACINHKDANGDTALSFGFYVGIVNIKNIECLLKNGADVNVINKNGKTALDLALIKNGQKYTYKEDQEKMARLVELLRSYGALTAEEVKKNDTHTIQKLDSGK